MIWSRSRAAPSAKFDLYLAEKYAYMYYYTTWCVVLQTLCKWSMNPRRSRMRGHVLWHVCPFQVESIGRGSFLLKLGYQHHEVDTHTHGRNLPHKTCLGVMTDQHAHATQLDPHSPTQSSVARAQIRPCVWKRWKRTTPRLSKHQSNRNTSARVWEKDANKQKSYINNNI